MHSIKSLIARFAISSGKTKFSNLSETTMKVSWTNNLPHQFSCSRATYQWGRLKIYGYMS